MTERNDPTSTSLIVIARDTTGQIITRISSNRDLLGALHTARCLLRLKVEATHTEIHHREHITSNYPHKPIASLNREDLAEEPVR